MVQYHELTIAEAYEFVFLGYREYYWIFFLCVMYRLIAHHYFYSYKRNNGNSNSRALARMKTLLATGRTALANQGRLTTFLEMSRLGTEEGRAAVRHCNQIELRPAFSDAFHSHNN